MIQYTTATADLSLEQRVRWAQLTQKFPAHTYIPTKAQAELYKAVGELVPEKRIFLMTSGNGVGKTTGVVQLINNVVYPNVNIYRNIEDVQTGEKYSGFFDYPFFNNFPKDWPHEIWYVSNKDSLATIIKRFREGGPRESVDGTPIQIEENKDGKTWVAKLRYPGTDWVLYFKTVDQDPATFESAEVSIMVFDEPPPLNLYRASVSRLRAGGIILIPATPLFSAAWFVDEIIEKIDIDMDKWHQTVPVWTNCIETAGEWDLGEFGIQKKGNLRQSNIEFTLRNYDPDEREAREHGTFKYLSGLVYRKSYDKDLHWRPVSTPPLPHAYMYRMIIDPHDRKPPAVMWLRFDRFGRRSIIREWPSMADPQYNNLPFHKIKDAGDFTIRDFCRFWIEIEEEWKIPHDRISRIIDPNYGNKINRRTGKKLYEEYMIESQLIFREMKLGKNRSFSFITDVVDDLAIGHKAVKQLLKPTPDGDLMWEVDESCFNVNYAMTHYSFDERTALQEEKHGMTEKVRDFAKDFADLVRYDAMIPFTWSDIPLDKDPYERDYEKADWRQKFARPDGADGV